MDDSENIVVIIKIVTDHIEDDVAAIVLDRSHAPH